MLICCSINISDYYECWKTVVLLHNFVENVIPCEMWSVLGKIKKYKVIFFFNNVALNQRLWSEVICGQVWWPILGIFGLHLNNPCAHTTGAVGSQCCGTRGTFGGSVPCSRVSPQAWYWRRRECSIFTPPTYNLCRPKTRTRDLQVTCPTL